MSTRNPAPLPAHDDFGRMDELAGYGGDAVVVARLRSALDWMIAHPDWEGAIALSIAQLGYKGKRQGIGFRSAALALPTEAKVETMRHALKSGLAAPSPAETQRLCNLWGVGRHEIDRARPRTSRQDWRMLRDRLLVRLGARHEEYKRSQTQLFLAYLPLADQVARQIGRQPSQRDDLRQEAALALLEAIDRIDPDKPFAPYARSWMRRRALNALMREASPVSAPINALSRSFRGDAAPSAVGLAAARQRPLPLDHPDANTALADGMTPDEATEQRDKFDRLRSAMAGLTDKQQRVLSLRFGLEDAIDPLSLSEVAATVGISRQQVHQRERRALDALARLLVGP